MAARSVHPTRGGVRVLRRLSEVAHQRSRAVEAVLTAAQAAFNLVRLLFLALLFSPVALTASLALQRNICRPMWLAVFRRVLLSPGISPACSAVGHPLTSALHYVGAPRTVPAAHDPPPGSPGSQAQPVRLHLAPVILLGCQAESAAGTPPVATKRQMQNQ